MSKFLVATFILAVFVQIIFSFFYSSEIINQNNILFKNQQKLEQLKTINQSLQKQLAQTTSLDHLQTIISQQNLQPISQEIDLSQP